MSKLVCLTSVRKNSYRASIGKISRPVYSRLYPVRLVKPDGSAINIKYHEPIGIIKLPFDLNKLDEVDRKHRLLKRQMSNKLDSKKKSSGIIDKTVKFDPKKYLNIKKTES